MQVPPELNQRMIQVLNEIDAFAQSSGMSRADAAVFVFARSVAGINLCIDALTNRTDMLITRAASAEGGVH